LLIVALLVAGIMRLIIRPAPEDVGRYTAMYIARRINAAAPTAQRPFVLGLPTGSTPLPTYNELIKLVKKGDVSFRHVVTFNMDEYVGLPKDHPQRFVETFSPSPHSPMGKGNVVSGFHIICFVTLFNDMTFKATTISCTTTSSNTSTSIRRTSISWTVVRQT
jgi:hypothetical protein